MGINGIYKIQNLITMRSINISSLSGHILIVDALNILNKYGIGIRNRGKDFIINGKVVNHIYTIYYFTNKLLKMNILPIYIFDGKPVEQKNHMLENRQKKKTIAKSKLDNDKLTFTEYKKYFKQSYKLTKSDINECKQLLEYMGIQSIQAPQEADSQCALLARKYKYIISGVITDDSDLLLYGCPNIFKNFNIKNNTTEVISYDETINNFIKKSQKINSSEILHKNIYYNKFVEFCSLLGSDYNKSVMLFTRKQENIERLFELYVLENMDLDKLLIRLKFENKNNPLKKKIYNTSKITTIHIKRFIEIYSNPVILNCDINNILMKKPEIYKFTNFINLYLNYQLNKSIHVMTTLLKNYMYFIQYNIHFSNFTKI